MHKQILAIRHAESVGNAGGATKSPGDNPLSDKGIQQSKDLIGKIFMKPELVVVSKYVRTQQTIKPFVDMYKTPVEIWNLHEFCFLNPAKYVGTTQQERQPYRNEYYDRCDPHYCDGGEAESFIDFATRIEMSIHQMRMHSAQKIISVSHELTLLCMGFLFEERGFEPIKKSGLKTQKKLMRDFRDSVWAQQHIPNAAPFDISHYLLVPNTTS